MAQLVQYDEVVVGFSHGIVTWFDHAPARLRAGQGAGMVLLHILTPLRQGLTKQWVFGVNQTPYPEADHAG